MAASLSTTPDCSSQLASGIYSSGRSGLRPSLVRGESPRNAPLTPLLPPGLNSNVALRNRRPTTVPARFQRVAIPPRAYTAVYARPPPFARSTVRRRPPQFLPTSPCPLPPAVRRSGLRPSLVRGDSPRNAPLTPLLPPGLGSNVALRNRRPIAPPQINKRHPTVGAGLVPALCLSQSR